MKNERMYNELIELLTTDSAAGKENAIGEDGGPGLHRHPG